MKASNFNELKEFALQRLCDNQAEEDVIGGLLADAGQAESISEILKPEDFRNPSHALAFSAIQKAFQEHGVGGVNLSVVSRYIDELQSDAKTRERWGKIENPIVFLSDLISRVPDSLTLQSGAERIQQLSSRARLALVATEIANMAVLGEQYPYQRMLELAQEKIYQARNNEEQAETGLRHLAIYGEQSRIRYQRIKEGNFSDFYIPTPWSGLNEKLIGWEVSSLNLIVARPSQGKTAVILQCALEAAQKYNKRVAIFSLETPGQKLYDRLVCIMAGINGRDLRKGTLSPEDEEKYEKAAEELDKLPIFIDEESSVSPMALRTRCRYYRYGEGVDIIFIDYLQLMQDEENERNETLRVGNIARSLKLIARDLGIAVVTAGQLGRGVERRENKRAQLSDIRFGGEQDADTVTAIHNPRPDPNELVDDLDVGFDVLKNRDGPIGSAPMVWHPENTTFRDKDIIKIEPEEIIF